MKHVKSNAIVLANQQQTVGIGAGQMNRVGSVKIAVEQARENNKLAGSVLASDAFSQWMTVLNMQRNRNQSDYSTWWQYQDQESIDMADKYGVAMVFTGVRHFKH